MNNSDGQKEDSRREVEKHIRVLKEKIDNFLSEDKQPDVLIIKSHLVCEYYLNQILIVKDISNANEIHNKLTFSDKVTKALDLGVPNEKNIHDRLRKLNTLRNKVGHELEYKLSEFDVDGIGYLTGKQYVFDKYDFDDTSKLLRNTLMMIVIDLSMLVFDLVSKEKNRPATPVERIKK